MRNILLASFFTALVIGGGVSLYNNLGSSSVAETSTPSTGVNYAAMPIRYIVKDQQVLRSFLVDRGIKDVISKLVQESGGGSNFDCHQESHTIGRVGYTIYKEKAFQQCDPSCHSGCYHGAMEAFLNEKGTADLAKNINAVCNLFDTSFGRFECLHGVGHGLLAYVDYDMPDAVKECKSLKDWFGTVSCYGGMFMENILTGQGLGASTKTDHGTKWVNQTDPYFPCDALDTKDSDLQYQCYQMQTSWMLTLSKFDFGKVAKECSEAPNNMTSVCFKSFGRDSAGNTLRDPKGIMTDCALVPRIKDYYDQCMIGALNVIVDFWGPSLKSQATDLCKLNEEPTKLVCYRTLAARIPDLLKNKANRAAICATFEDKYKNLCSGFVDKI